jgi:glycosyltransferase involved in cell wall biosynthesis
MLAAWRVDPGPRDRVGRLASVERLGPPRTRRDGVLLLFPELDFGGVESLAIMQVRAMGDRCLRVCALDRDGRAASEIRRTGVLVDVLCTAASIRNPIATWRLWRYLRRTRPLIIHARTGAMTFHGLVAATLARVPVRIVEEVGTPSRGRVGRVVFPWLYRLATCVVAVSDSVADYLVCHDGVPEEKIRRIHNAIDDRFFSCQPSSGGDRFRIVVVGRLVPVKGIDVLLEAVAPLLRSDPEVSVTVVGDGPERGRLEQFAADLRISSSVEFPGYRADIAGLLEKADVFVLPSWSEGLPLALAEAMAAGIPVIATRVGGVPEVVPEWAGEWLVPAGDPSALLGAVGRMRGLDPARRRELGERLRDHADGEYSSRRYVAEMGSLYDELAPTSGARS